MTRRISDSSAEREVAKYLDYHLYYRLTKAPLYGQSQRTDTYAEQLAGSDVILHASGKTYIIDEKAQIYYINKSLPTFAFEVDSIQRGVRRSGWLYNDNLKTTHYLLIWPHAKHTNHETLKTGDITKLDCICVEKTAIQGMLHKQGWSQERIEQESHRIRDTVTYGRIDIGNPMFYLYHSKPARYSETPINIVMSRKAIESAAEFRVTVFSSHIELY